MLKSWHTANTGEWSLVMMSLVHPAAMNIRIPNVSHATCGHTRTHTYTRARTQTRTHAHMHERTHTQKCIRTYLRTNTQYAHTVYTHVHKYTNTHFHCPPPTIALVCLTICKTGDPETRVGLPQHSIAVRGHIDSGLRWAWQTPNGHLVHTTSHVIVYVCQKASYCTDVPLLLLHTCTCACLYTHTHTCIRTMQAHKVHTILHVR